MRAIKLGLIFFTFLFVLMTLFSLLVPSHIRISRATNVPNKKETVLVLLQSDFLWKANDEDSSESIHRFNKKIIEQTDSTYVLQLQQKGRKPVISGWQLHGASPADSLALQWYMDFQLSWYPWEKFSSLFYEKTYGVMMENGLSNLKKQLIP